MTRSHSLIFALLFAITLGATACKPKTPPAPPAPAPAQASAAAAPTPVAAAAGAVDLDKIAVSTVALPPFPYIDYPAGVPPGLQFGNESAFDQLSVIVGDKLHTVEGRYKLTEFPNKDAKISRFQALRDYNDAAIALGGVKVNRVVPDDAALAQPNDDAMSALRTKLRFEAKHSYDSYLIPTPTGRVWLVVMVADDSTRILAIQEKQTASSVQLVNADAIKSALDTKGRIALYINFDTDKAILRPDGRPGVDEIAKLLKQDTGLRLSIEGHTDNQGVGARNQALSAERAQAVLQALADQGIEQSRLSATGHGADKPIANNADEAGRAKNRRVELVKVSKG
ncbi:MAG: OmpA family protein [Pseudomonadota bacterium]